MSTGVLHRFYCSKEWRTFRELIIDTRSKNGVICEDCGKTILQMNDIHIHHTPIELTEANYMDRMISLNPDNVKMICKDCHDKAHDRFCGKRKKKERGIYIVCGPPMAGKTSYVMENMTAGDLVIDMDKIYAALSLRELYDKPDNLKYNVFAIKNMLVEHIKTRYGNFRSGWIIGGYPNKVERERLAYELGAEVVSLVITKDECYSRLESCKDYRGQHKGEWKKYIDEWFENYSK